MKIVVAGGSGFLGTPLVEALALGGHEVVVLSRDPRTTPAWAFVPEAVGRPGTRTDPSQVRVAAWSPDGEAGAWAATLEGAGAVVNLAGASLGDGRWTDARKAVLRNSRLLPTRSLARAIARLAAPPSVFVSASGVGYYGLTGDELLTEDAPAGSDFIAALCIDWEAEANAASNVTRVALLRSGVVLGPGAGALERMLRPFRLFAGGRLGSGRQYFSWIHRADWVRLVSRIIADPGFAGPFNASAPGPVTNREFARVAGRLLRRPSLVPAPAFALRLLLGEMADALVLGGQRAVPARALDRGFTFRFSELQPALADVLSTPGQG